MREYGTVLVDELNVRLKPGSDSRDIIGNVSKGDRLTIIGRRDGEKARWLEIEWRGYAAWVAERNASAVYVGIDAIVPDCAPEPPRAPDDGMSRLVLYVGITAIVLVPLFAWLLG